MRIVAKGNPPLVVTVKEMGAPTATVFDASLVMLDAIGVRYEICCTLCEVMLTNHNEPSVDVVRSRGRPPTINRSTMLKLVLDQRSTEPLPLEVSQKLESEVAASESVSHGG